MFQKLSSGKTTIKIPRTHIKRNVQRSIFHKQTSSASNLFPSKVNTHFIRLHVGLSLTVTSKLEKKSRLDKTF